MQKERQNLLISVQFVIHLAVYVGLQIQKQNKTTTKISFRGN